MKYMFASDVHGSAHYCRKMLEAYCQSGADRLILLGDLLYHGPRNDLPQEYAPKQVIAMLNKYKNEIIAVRGNCEAEVDQMVLEFPVMADYAILVLNGLTFFATHGHLFNQDQMPPLKAGDILVHGHTHLLKAEKVNGHYILNPGSTSIPKGGNPELFYFSGREGLPDGLGVLDSLDPHHRVTVWEVSVVKQVSKKAAYNAALAVLGALFDLPNTLVVVQIAPDVSVCDLTDRFVDVGQKTH